jgi:hypothetical protein
MLPKIRNADELLIADMGDEVIVYDAARKKRHSLNMVSAFIFQLCDGQTSPEEMSTRLRDELQIPHAHKVTWIVLDQFEKAQLLADELIRPRNLQATATCRM